MECSGYKAYGCELCPAWLHAKCVFPNASDNDLKILYKFNSEFDVKCLSCKNESKQKCADLVKDVKEIKEQMIQFLSQANDIQKLGISNKETLIMTTEPSTSTKGQKSFQSNALTMNSHKSTKLVLLLKSDESNGAYSEQA